MYLSWRPGTYWSFLKKSEGVVSRSKVRGVYVDGLGVGDVGNIVQRQTKPIRRTGDHRITGLRAENRKTSVRSGYYFQGLCLCERIEDLMRK